MTINTKDLKRKRNPKRNHTRSGRRQRRGALKSKDVGGATVIAPRQFSDGVQYNFKGREHVLYRAQPDGSIRKL